MSEDKKYLPKFIKDSPWYISSSHNGKSEKDNSVATLGDDIHDKFVRYKQSKSRPKGNFKCSNCFSMDHMKNDCLEPPRKLNKNFDASETFTIKDSSQKSYDEKRDRWFGFNLDEYKELINKNKKIMSSHDEILLKYDFDDFDVKLELFKLNLTPAQISNDLKHKDNHISVRSRTDNKPGYLNDLNDDNIAKYDPKSRLYKDEKIGEIDSDTKIFKRFLNAESLELEKLNKFAMASSDGNSESIGANVLVGNPTKFELMMKKKDL